MLSGLLHAVLLLALVSAADPSRSKPRTLQSYTVSLVAPAALESAPAPPPAPKPQPPKVEAEKPKVETKKPKVESKKPKVETKKPKVESEKPKVETKKPKREKVEKKPKVAKPEEKKPVNIAARKKPRPKKAPAQKPERAQEPQPPKEPEERGPSAEEREQQIVAALERVRQRLQAETPSSTASVGQGGGDTLRGLPFILYTQEVKQRVKQSWIVAEPKPGLTAVVRFGILANGEVVEVELAERSGDIVFDESAMRAVRKASPLSPPPEAYRNEFTRQKVEVVFGETQRVRSQQVRGE